MPVPVIYLFFFFIFIFFFFFFFGGGGMLVKCIETNGRNEDCSEKSANSSVQYSVDF